MDDSARKREVAKIAVGEAKVGEPVRLFHPPFDIVFVLTEQGAFALEDACNHAGASLADGVVEDGCIRCPDHGYRFHLGTGDLVEPRGLCDGQRVFEVHREGDAYVVYDALRP